MGNIGLTVIQYVALCCTQRKELALFSIFVCQAIGHDKPPFILASILYFSRLSGIVPKQNLFIIDLSQVHLYQCFCAGHGG